MDFRLTLGEDMHLTSQGEVILRQGSHLMDNIVIDLGGKYEGASAYLEFDLPKSKKYVTPTTSIAGNISFGVPGDVTANSGFGYLQLTILAGEIIEKSALFAFEVITSICSSHYYSEKDKHDFFFNAEEILRDGRMQAEASREANANAQRSITEMNTLKADIEAKLMSGAFKGAKGDNGQDGRNGIDGVDGKNGENGVDGVNGADGANGMDGITPHIGANGNWYIGETDTGKRAVAKDGAKGETGLSPHIGPNKHWFIGEEDTGVKAEGADGIGLVDTLGNSETVAMSQAAVTRELRHLYEHEGVFEGVADIPIDHFDGMPVIGYLGVYDTSCTRACYSIFLGIPPRLGATNINLLTYPLIENGLIVSGNQNNGLTISQIKSLKDIKGFYHYRHLY